MAYILDTSVAIGLRDGDPAIAARVDALDGPAMLSVVTHVELEGGVYRNPETTKILRPRLDAILAIIPVVAFDDRSAAAYRTIVQAAGYSRRKVLDRMIAAQAIVHRATLVTLNGAHFRDCPGLQLIEW